METSKKLSLFLLVGITVSIPTITLAQNKNCPVLPRKEIILKDSETVLYNLPSLNSPVIYTIKKNQAFRLLDLSGKYINKMCWYKVESPLNNETAWAGFFIAEKPTIQPSITPTIKKKNPTPISKPTPINRPRKAEASKDYNYSPYFLIPTSIIGIFFLFLLHEIILSLKKKSKPKLRKNLQETNIQNNNINQNYITKPLLTSSPSDSNTPNINQQSNLSNTSERSREIDLGILNYLRKNDNASFIDLLSNLQCDKQLLRDRLLILQEEEFIKIVNKADENNTIYKML
jgi:hypothetical protein